MFNKLKQQITNLNSKKKTDSKLDILEDSETKDFEVDFENLWKYNIEELCDFLRKYDKYTHKLRKKLDDISEEHLNFRKKFEQTEKEKKRIIDEKEQFKMHLDNIQKNLDMETKEKEKYRLELDFLRKEKDKMKNEIENFKKDIHSPELSISVNLSQGNLKKIFKFIEPKYLKNMENKLEEMTDFLNENLKIINTGLLDKIKYILSQPEEEKNPTESNRSNYDDEYSNNGTNREDMDSCRDNIQSCRSNKTEQCMNLNDLVVEMYEELHMIVGALPNLENMRAKVKELVENFSLINETLVKYQIEMKEIVSEEVEKMKKELVFAKKDAEENKEAMEKKNLEIGNKKEELNILKSENIKMKNTLSDMQKKFENEIRTLLDQITSENSSLKVANQKIKEEYEEISKTKRKLEEDYTNENKKLLKELEDYKLNTDCLEKKIKNSDEVLQSKQKDLESKIQQEKNKYEQKVKDYSKLEESYRDFKNNSAKQMDDFNRIIEKAKQIEIQLNDEKKNHKELKMKHNDILSLLEEEKRLKNSLIKEKDEISKNFSEKSKKLEEEITMQMQEKTNISKDLLIKNLEIKMAEASEKSDIYNGKLLKLQEENENLKLELKTTSDVICSMKEKRESALKEIKRLTTQIDQLKLNNKKSDIIIENSYSQIPDFNINNNNNSGSNNINGDNHNNNFNRNFKELQSKSSVDKTKTNISSIDTSQMLKNYTNKSFNKLIIEGNYLCLIKKELEGLYKDFIPLMPWDAEKKQQVLFIKLERKMNDCIQKAQDLIDTIEDIG